jgi:hypothetical protein
MHPLVEIRNRGYIYNESKNQHGIRLWREIQRRAQDVGTDQLGTVSVGVGCVS